MVLGPTASGKTSVAIELARHFSTEILSADSRQFFRELNIGVARPSQEQLQAVRHHFIAFISIHGHYSSGTFEHDALRLLEHLFSTHDVVICAGGSGLYIQSLLNGMDDLPSDIQLKMKWAHELEKNGIESLQKELELRDAEYFGQVDTANPSRLMRALEVIELTGQKYSTLRSRQKAKRPFRILKIGLDVPRDLLYQKIDARVNEMMDAGLEQEATSLFPFRHFNSLNTVGYKELFEYFEGKCSLPDAIEKIKQHTRNYSKRQLTWWRRDEEITWMSPENSSILNFASATTKKASS
mgnify:CR=1 FL=1